MEEITIHQSEKCINCLLCVHVCPLLNNPMTINSNYPNAIINIDRDKQEETLLTDINYYCLTCLQCKITCPRNLDPTKAIMQVRRKLSENAL